ncbi:SNF2 family ATP-dependent chromatin-remodeling factor snf22 [Schizosaccharomyces octosporus yFS286]|uniref:SNF2 family ATP-dependent chromatin-remodeling factor snf22 n=1 Tax=Schizosaccharomyces octosporus (strain yFS286) TaxID=483514 RepID=S9Q1S3_SCHOY|nr:SNF2 family ATP-dependent chromatin-remodeling factor snf22 [Schizosaccharomyces octosporus yFS286]EPX73648.1 SNF2 family ATP-dependent chromatin-remodeling factor snf22 [Schizosaccharomyces octosporus yFS286]
MSTPYVNPNFLRGLTKDNVRAIYRRWQFLKSQGATEESNPEFAHLTSVLRSIQKIQYTARLQQISKQNQLSQAENVGSSAVNETPSIDQNPMLSHASPVLPNVRSSYLPDVNTPSSVPPDASVNLMNTNNEVPRPDPSYPLQGHSTSPNAGFPSNYSANTTDGNSMNSVNYYRSNLQNTDTSMNTNARGMMPHQYFGSQSMDANYNGNPPGALYNNPVDSTSLGNGNHLPSASSNQTPSFDHNPNVNPYTGKRFSNAVPMQPMLDRRASLSVNPRRSSTPGTSMPTPPYTNYKGDSLPPRPVTYSPSFPSQQNFPTSGNVNTENTTVPHPYSYGHLPNSSNIPGENHVNGNQYMSSDNSVNPGPSIASGSPQLAPAPSASPNMLSSDPVPAREFAADRSQSTKGRPQLMNVGNPYASSLAKSQPVAFNPVQLSLLKNQIMAYNSLNSPFGQIPQPIQKAIFGKTLPEVPENILLKQQNRMKQTNVEEPSVPLTSQKETQPEDIHYTQKRNSQSRLDTARLNSKVGKASVSPHTSARNNTVKPTVSPVTYSSCTDPKSYIEAPISYEKFSSAENLKLVPSLLSPGLSWDFIFRNSEVAIACSVGNRVNVLEDLSATEENHSSSENKSLGTKQMIELRCLRLLEKQRKLRTAVSSTIQQSEILAAGNLRNMFRTVKHQSLQEANTTLAVAEQQNNAHALKQKEKLLSHLRSILQHGKSVSNKASNRKQKYSQMGKDVMCLHTHYEKEEKKRIEKSARARLQALRADDEAAYLELVDKAKDSRITHLLRQTDSFLESLTEAVRVQQSTIHGGNTSGKEEKLSNATAEDEDELSMDYYNVAHRIHEEAEQPKIFVGGNLKDYQLKGLEWMLSLYNNNLNGILADEMGLGKTVQTIAFITYLIEKKNNPGPFLIIVPLSTLTNWNLEFEKWAPSVTKITYRGPPQLRKAYQMQIKSNNFNVLLTTFDYIIKDRPLLSKVKWLYSIIDEGHRLKNTQSKLTSTLCSYYHSQYRLILTGTPLQNNLPELWALLNVVLPKIFNSVKSFDEWFNTPFANTGGQDKFELTEEESLLVIKRLHKVLRPFLFRRLKKDVESELPDKVEKVIKCPLSGLQFKLYQQMKKHGMLFVAGDKGKTGMKVLQNTVMQLKKICNHPFIFEEVERAIDPSGTNYDLLWRAAGKFELLDRILPKLFKTGHKTLIFFQMTQIMTIMEDYLRYRNWKYLRLDGSTKSEDRSDLLSQFNDPASDIYVFMLSTRAGGLGLNLQTADTVIIFDTDWNPHQDLQAQDRAHRIGQTKEVRILRLISEKSIEENILSRAQFKLDLDGKVIQAGKFDNKSTPEEREAFLRSLLEHDGEEDNDLGYSELQNDELNELISRTDDELELFRMIDQERAVNDIYGKGKALDRLLSVNELPEIYRAEVDHVVKDASEDIPFDAGRQKRQRASVSYAEPGFEDTYEEGSKNDMPRRRGRPRKKLALDNLNYSGPLVYESRSSRRVSEDPSTHKYAALQRCLKEIYESIFHLQDETGRLVNGLFLYPPSRKLYPDYYVIIKHPIALGKIGRNIKNGRYTELQGLVSDFMLMFSNAYTYNEEFSPVYEDAKFMERTLTSILEKFERERIFEKYEKEEFDKLNVGPMLDLEKDHIETESNMELVTNDKEFEIDQDYDDLTSEE